MLTELLVIPEWVTSSVKTLRTQKIMRKKRQERDASTVVSREERWVRSPVSRLFSSHVRKRSFGIRIFLFFGRQREGIGNSRSSVYPTQKDHIPPKWHQSYLRVPRLIDQSINQPPTTIMEKPAKLTFQHERAVNLARRYTEMNENDLVMVRSFCWKEKFLYKCIFDTIFWIASDSLSSL